MDITKAFNVVPLNRRDQIFSSVTVVRNEGDAYLSIREREWNSLRAIIEVEFRCTRETYPQALKVARAQVYRHVYGDVVQKLREMEEAIWAEDYRKIDGVYGEVIAMMRGEPLP